ncbi:hypothetical protein DICPUDRAFT_93840 [Dictyostelium purpureum]|uniref:Metallo-beta-lactamase domain-containing protein n=1 Tax=Dictyostelium purpureum TaxID=5786 RepID=F0ZCD1_DICPU|nr:uncharacterized protein DICPUDRAFT_93840 [Dictyostelium purpureum]EGC38401.1 hypothetical protein DICPUDRAFT_93840 [Dictyostelium purpureum]|eukprot:XP_003285062.1 hypothetical protein DICPUDRAFT_93840 [Dictyostelium purpureum]
MEPINNSVEEFERIKSKLVNGRYENPFGHIVSTSEVFSWFRKRRQFHPIKPLTEHEKTVLHPVLKPDFQLLSSEYNHETTIRSTWIGHSTVLVQIEGYNFLTDPVWSERCTPFPSLPLGPARYTKPACKISELPKIDFVVISHTHYDHLDHNSVCEINKIFKPKFFVPFGMKQWFLDSGITDVEELDWWQETTFKDNLKLIYTPVNHSSQRGLLDKNKTLWGGWIVKGKHQSFYFAGDTAYNDKLFKVIGHHYGPFNFALIPIGAYDMVREFMRHNHIDPEEAVRIHKEIKSKRSFGVHWGTFILTCEPLLEPPKKLYEESQKQGLKENEFFVSKIGETNIQSENFKEL